MKRMVNKMPYLKSGRKYAASAKEVEPAISKYIKEKVKIKFIEINPSLEKDMEKERKKERERELKKPLAW